MKKAVVLFSGGLDSSTLVYYAKSKGFQAHCLVFDYGQRHSVEIKKAENLAGRIKCQATIVKIQLPWQGSSLLDKSKKIPDHLVIDSKKIPSTYVPARNIIFLSFAVSWAEVLGAKAVFIGANALDYSGYPDCRPKFFHAYQQTIRCGLKTGVQGKLIKIYTPLLKKTKAQIIKMGMKLKVPYQYTWSCYQGGLQPCGRCDSCRLRAKGFIEAGVKDPLIRDVNSR
ncbi:MAG: 7-cyano-7-deazaguanine synthase QueC [Candidatus Omnitrophica bacterium]|nr:7-cyano-7-deazaguanine synthase QueC [Candidatus Omnitrophota bacterium]